MLQELMEVKHKLEGTVQDVTMKQSSLEAENERLQSDLQTIRHDFKSLGSDRSEQERELTQLRMKVAVMEQDLKMKDEQMMRVSEELTFERDAKVGWSVGRLVGRSRSSRKCIQQSKKCKSQVFWILKKNAVNVRVMIYNV